MSVTLRQKLVHAAITGVTLGSVVVAGLWSGHKVTESQASQPESASTFVGRPSAHDLHVQHVRHDACGAVSRLSEYSVRYEDGSAVTVPSGATLLREDRSMLACLAYLRQFVQDHS